MIAEASASVVVFLVRLFTGVRARWQTPDGPPAPDTGASDCAQRVYFANHSSHLDAVVVWSALPPNLRAATRPVAAADYWTGTPLRRFMARNVFHCVLIDRSPRAARQAIDDMLAAIGDRFSLILFPEGTRGDGEELGRFRAGLYHIAQARPDLELVPVYLENLNRVLPKGEILPVPVLGGATFGPAIRLQPDEDKQAFMDRARDAVLALRHPDHGEGDAA